MANKKLALDIENKNYVVDLNEEMASFVESDLGQYGFDLGGDNGVELLLKAYLQQVKERIQTQHALDDMIGSFQENPEENN